MVLAVAKSGALHLTEATQHACVVPADISLIRPGIVIMPAAAQVNHAVEATRSTQDLSPWPGVDPVGSMFLRHCPVSPVDLGAPQREVHRRIMDAGMGIRPSGFQEKNRDLGVS